MRSARLVALLILLFASASVRAQQITITGTVKDPNGIPYQNGRGRAILVPTNVAFTTGITNPVPGSQSPVIIDGLDAFGRFSVTLTSTAAIDQQTSNPQWLISFCSGSYPVQGPLCFTVPALSLTSSQDITAQINAAPPATLPGLGSGTGVPGGINNDPQCNKTSVFGVCVNDPAILYLTATGNDSARGTTWDSAKLTVAAACSALPGGNSSCSAGHGQLYVDAGYAVVLPSGTSPNIQLIHYQQGIFTGNASPVPGNTGSSPVPTGIDIREFGGRTFASPVQTLTVTTNGTSTVTTTGTADFQVGDDLVIGAGGAATAQTTPGAPTIQLIGANGSSTISYQCVGVDTQWGLTAASPATSVSTAPQVFGQAAVGVSSATWIANVVTVNTSSAMPFTSGTFHVMIPQLISSGNQIGGIELATIVSSTQLTYSLTGSGTVTVGAGAAVLFVNGFVLTQVSETAGSNQIVLTTDVNHNLQQQIGTLHPTELFLDGINFPGESIPGYANGLFTISSITANTVTVVTPHVASLTENASALVAFATSSVAQMTALVYAEIAVTCPQNANGTPSTGGAYYAVYANYGSGFGRIGFTPWQHSIFVDYGPGNTQAGFTPPAAMNLPATPPVSAQAQVFEGKVLSISGTTFTMDRAVPQSLSGVTGYHSDGISLQNAVNQACQRSDGITNQNFYNVYLPAASGSVFGYLFNAPVDIGGGSNHCSRISVVDAGAVTANGTIYALNSAFVEWKKPRGGLTTVGTGAAAGGVVSWFGVADPMIGTSFTWEIEGMGFTTQSNGQNAVVNTGINTKIEKSSFGAFTGNLLSSVPLLLAGSGFQVRLRDLSWGTIPNPLAPTAGVCGNCGEVMWWPVPTIAVIGGPSNYPNVIWEGINYGNSTGITYDGLYPGPFQNPAFVKIENIQTFQEPFEPLLTIRGDFGLSEVRLERIQMDSIGLPVVANLNCSSCGRFRLQQAYAIGVTHPVYTGFTPKAIDETGESELQPPSSNLTSFAINSNGATASMTLNAFGGLNYTPTAFDNFNRANGAVGQNWSTIPSAGTFNVTSNQVQGNTVNDNMMIWTGLGSFSRQGMGQFAQLTLTTLGGRSGPTVFTGALNFSGYSCNETSTTLSISSIQNGAPLTTLATTPVSGNNGDVVRIEAIPAPLTSNNVTVNCYLNSAPPSAPTITFTGNGNGSDTGYPGIDLFGTTVRGDNWSGGYLPSLAGLGIEQAWTQTQHFTQPVTIGATNPVAGALAANTLYVPNVATDGGTPTCSATGTGTGATCGVFLTNSDDQSGAFTISTGTTPAATGTVTLTFNNSTGGFKYCGFFPSNAGLAGWNARVSFIITTAGGGSNNQAAWDNNAVNLTGSTTYVVQYVCGRH